MLLQNITNDIIYLIIDKIDTDIFELYKTCRLFYNLINIHIEKKFKESIISLNKNENNNTCLIWFIENKNKLPLKKLMIKYIFINDNWPLYNNNSLILFHNNLIYNSIFDKLIIDNIKTFKTLRIFIRRFSSLEHYFANRFFHTNYFEIIKKANNILKLKKNKKLRRSCIYFFSEYKFYKLRSQFNKIAIDIMKEWLYKYEICHWNIDILRFIIYLDVDFDFNLFINNFKSSKKIIWLHNNEYKNGLSIYDIKIPFIYSFFYFILDEYSFSKKYNNKISNKLCFKKIMKFLKIDDNYDINKLIEKFKSIYINNNNENFVNFFLDCYYSKDYYIKLNNSIYNTYNICKKVSENQ